MRGSNNKSEYYKLLRMRIPYLIEEKLGIDMTYTIMVKAPDPLSQSKARHAIKDNDLTELKAMLFSGESKIDDALDVYCVHTLLHDAVILNRKEIFRFLIQNKANLNIRDCHGYTPLLKAASIGRLDMCKALIEAGVDPRHKDPFGNTA